MKKGKKFAALLLVASMVVAGLTGCGNKDDVSTSSGNTPTPAKDVESKDVTLTVWSAAEDQKAYDGYPSGLLAYWCDEFNKAHPEWNITFKYEVCSEADAKNTILKDVEVAADVFMYANDQIPELVNAGAIAKIGGSALENMKASNSQTMVDSVSFEGGYYGFPYTPNTVFLYYDSSIFTEDEVKSLNTMMEKDLPAGVAAFSHELTNSWHIEQFYYAGGMSLFGVDGTDGAAGTNVGDLSFVTEYLIDLVANPKFHKEAGDDSIAMFSEGKLGAFITGSWKADAIKTALGDNFATAALPAVTFDNGVTGNMKQFTGSKAVGANSHSKNLDVAIALAEYLGSEDVQMIRFENRSITPVHVSLANNADVLANPIASAESAVVAGASMAQPLVNEMQNWWSPAETMGNEIFNGTVTKGNAAEKTKAFQDSVNAGSGL